ncbi:MAG: DUF1289 domain-containing protein [Pseudomonadota bacterium]|nr:DUF1289 domain-containing protein [Pseudomonadota bacterium]
MATANEADEEIRHRSDESLIAIAQTVTTSDDRIPSPCVSVCRIDARTGLCEGCYRTLREISGWARSGSVAQRALWRTILRRRAAALNGQHERRETFAGEEPD